MLYITYQIKLMNDVFATILKVIELRFFLRDGYHINSINRYCSIIFSWLMRTIHCLLCLPWDFILRLSFQFFFAFLFIWAIKSSFESTFVDFRLVSSMARFTWFALLIDDCKFRCRCFKWTCDIIHYDNCSVIFAISILLLMPLLAIRYIGKRIAEVFIKSGR